MAGKNVWCNADWGLLNRVVPHFKKAAAAAPYDTQGVFVVPEQTWAPWWRLLKGFRVLARYPAQTQLFSRPLQNPDGGPPVEREFVRPTAWPVLALWWPPALRSPRAGRSGVPAHPDAGGLGGAEMLQVQLLGDGPRDAERLHHLRASLL